MLQKIFSRAVVAATVGAFAAVAAAGPAVAASQDAANEYKGRVISKTVLRVRSAPNLTGAVVGFVNPGQTIIITCKVKGQWVDGNPRWYKISENRWVSARYVKNVGPAPKWC